MPPSSDRTLIFKWLIAARATLDAASFAVLSFITPAIAMERVDICARYSATAKSYHVSAISETGSELNQATNSFNYNSLGHYIIIFWGQNQASIIEMSSIFFGLTYIPSNGTDQEGRSWEISAYTPVACSDFQ